MTLRAYTLPHAPPGPALTAAGLMVSVRAGVLAWQALLLLLDHNDQGWILPPLLLASSVAVGSVATILSVLHLLTRVTAQRLGGSFNIRNAAEHVGTVAELVVPLASLQSRSQ